MLILNKNQITYSILASIIPFLIWGPFFPDLIVSISSLVFLFYVFKNKNFYYFNKKPLKIFFIFCLYCIIVTLIRADDKLLSFESSLFFFRIGIFSCLIWYLIDQDKNILNYFYFSLIFCFSILIFDGYFQFFRGLSIFGLPYHDIRINSLFGDEYIMGSFLSRLFPLLFALFLVKKKNKYEIYYVGILFILVDTLIYLSGERTSFFFLNLSTIFIIIFIKKYQKFRLITFLIALIFISSLTFTSDKLSYRMIKEPIKYMGLAKDSENSNIFTPGHDSLYKTAFNMFLDKPFFGHGPKMFRLVCQNKKYQVGIMPCDTHPHNFYIQILAETGIVGFSFLFSLLFYVFFCVFIHLKSIILKKKRYLTDYQVCLLAGILITVWPLSPNGNFFNNWLIITYSLTFGFYLQSIYSKEKKNK